jgi:hypothetical protein
VLISLKFKVRKLENERLRVGRKVRRIRKAQE